MLRYDDYFGGLTAEEYEEETKEHFEYLNNLSKANSNKPANNMINPSDEDFGNILICAVRYALGRRTYITKLVVDFITPLLSQLSNKDLCTLERDIIWAKDTTGYGDEYIDKPVWMEFLSKIQEEIKIRKENL